MGEIVRHVYELNAQKQEGKAPYTWCLSHKGKKRLSATLTNDEIERLVKEVESTAHLGADKLQKEDAVLILPRSADGSMVSQKCLHPCYVADIKDKKVLVNYTFLAGKFDGLIYDDEWIRIDDKRLRTCGKGFGYYYGEKQKMFRKHEAEIQERILNSEVGKKLLDLVGVGYGCEELAEVEFVTRKTRRGSYSDESQLMAHIVYAAPLEAYGKESVLWKLYSQGNLGWLSNLGNLSHDRHTHGGNSPDPRYGDYQDAVFVNICLNKGYKGGNFIYWEKSESEETETKERLEFRRPGHVVCFPSNYPHAVSKV